MKVYPFKIPKPDNNALIYQEDIEKSFYDQLHQHDEIQISYIKKGKGTLFLGDRISSFSENDIYVIGANVPHAFKSDKNTDEISVMLTLFFTKSSFGDLFFELNEFLELKDFFSDSQFGLQITSLTKEIQNEFLKLRTASRMERFIILLEILKLISLSRTSKLSSFVYQKNYSDTEGKKMRAIFDYTLENANTPISLSDIANVANMTKNAFCKYFKKRTNKTYINFLTELRIENACKLLQSKKDLSISDIGFSCGFNNISNFNRKFKQVKKTTPLKYRNL
jgi:AraC-like DNA-binding protein/quercetin dioxygenase-like cupin family protein